MNDRTQTLDQADTRSEREKALEERLGSRTILVVIIAVVAIVELLVIVRLAI